MIRSLKQVTRLFAGSLRYLVFLDILFKILGGLILFPLCEAILHVALRLTNVHYISEQNIRIVLREPWLLGSMIVILLLILGFLAFEITCLAIAYQQSYYKHPIGLFQLLRESLLRTLGILHPRCWPLFPLLIFLFPTLYSFIENTSSSTIRLIRTLVYRTFTVFPTNVIAGIAAGLLLIVVLFGMFSFQYHFSQNANGFRSIRESVRIMRRNVGKILFRLLIWLALVAGALMLINLLVYGIISLGTYLFVQESIRKAVRVTIYHQVGRILNFISITYIAFAGYAFVASYFYDYCDAHKIASKPLTREKVPKARLRGGLTIGMLSLCILLTVVVNALMAYGVSSDLLHDRFFSDSIVIASHRGYVKEHRENTLGALQAGIDAQADLLEFDCQLTSDGVVALQHDKTLARCWGISKPLRDIHSSELPDIRNRQGEHLPTLREVFDLCKDQSVGFLIELKVNAQNRADLLAEAIMDLIEEYDLIDRCMLQSFSYSALTTAKHRNPDIVCGYLMNGSIGSYPDLEYADFFSVNMNYVTENTVSTVHLRNKKLMVWTINSEKRIHEAIELGVDGIITDEPILAREKIYGDDLLLEQVLENEDAEDSQE